MYGQGIERTGRMFAKVEPVATTVWRCRSCRTQATHVFKVTPYDGSDWEGMEGEVIDESVTHVHPTCQRHYALNAGRAELSAEALVARLESEPTAKQAYDDLSARVHAAAAESETCGSNTSAWHALCGGAENADDTAAELGYSTSSRKWYLLAVSGFWSLMDEYRAEADPWHRNVEDDALNAR